MVRTSTTHPLEIAQVEAPGGALIGLTFCPGKKQRDAATGPWDRDLDLDLDRIRGFGAVAVITLLENHELDALEVPRSSLSDGVRSRLMEWHHLPIVDAGLPDAAFESSWKDTGVRIRALLRAGGSVVVHCKGGLGRAGTISARLLVELGEEPQRAIDRVRAARPGAIETRAQEDHVRRCLAVRRDPGSV